MHSDGAQENAFRKGEQQGGGMLDQKGRAGSVYSTSSQCNVYDPYTLTVPAAPPAAKTP